MINLNKHTKLNLKPTLIFTHCSYVCAYHCAQLMYTAQHKTVLIIFPLILQTTITAQTMSTGGQEVSIYLLSLQCQRARTHTMLHNKQVAAITNDVIFSFRATTLFLILIVTHTTFCITTRKAIDCATTLPLRVFI